MRQVLVKICIHDFRRPFWYFKKTLLWLRSWIDPSFVAPRIDTQHATLRCYYNNNQQEDEKNTNLKSEFEWFSFKSNVFGIWEFLSTVLWRCDGRSHDTQTQVLAATSSNYFTSFKHPLILFEAPILVFDLQLIRSGWHIIYVYVHASSIHDNMYIHIGLSLFEQKHKNKITKCMRYSNNNDNDNRVYSKAVNSGVHDARSYDIL